MPIVQICDRNDVQGRYVYKVDTDSQPLGAGGMGKVYAGHRIDNATRTVTDVAVKFLFDNQPESVIDRARREANIQVKNDNLVEMLGFVEVEQRLEHGMVMRYHVVSELLSGVMLLDLLRGRTADAHGVEVPFARELYTRYKNDPVSFAIYVTKNILNGVLALHNAGYIHRDLDPSNVMITRDGKVKIIDFGIAKKVDTLSSNDRQLTSVGQFMGKAAYASPELISGDLASQNRTTDLYAIGIILYVLVVGELPFTGKLADIMNMQLTQPVPVKNVSDSRLRKVIAKATKKDQSKRYQSAAEFIVDLERIGNGPRAKSGMPSGSGNEKIMQILIWTAAIIGGLAVGIFLA